MRGMGTSLRTWKYLRASFRVSPRRGALAATMARCPKNCRRLAAIVSRRPVPVSCIVKQCYKSGTLEIKTRLDCNGTGMPP
eukprot:1351768-Amphidinium_carterae.2